MQVRVFIFAKTSPVTGTTMVGHFRGITQRQKHHRTEIFGAESTTEALLYLVSSAVVRDAKRFNKPKVADRYGTRTATPSTRSAK
jgi:hypothetical protein